MAVLSTEQLTELRQEMARDGSVVNWSKAQINAACQAIEDQIEGFKVTINTAINTATSPVVMPNATKKKLVKFYFRQKFSRGG